MRKPLFFAHKLGASLAGPEVGDKTCPEIWVGLAPKTTSGSASLGGQGVSRSFNRPNIMSSAVAGSLARSLAFVFASPNT